MSIPAVLVAGHAPFTWGKNADKSVENAMVLEQVAAMAFETMALNPGTVGIGQTLLDKHYLRKHGKNAYYGQK
jgi:L-ribulose-5-phosphate 4-epimerase